MEVQNANGLSKAIGYIATGHKMYVMTGDMPSDNNVLFNMDNSNTFNAVFEEQIIGMVDITLSLSYDATQMKTVLYMPADSKDIVQLRPGNVTWVMFGRTKDIYKFFCTNKVGKWGDDDSMVLFDGIDDVAVGLTRALKAISLEVQDVVPDQESSGDE